MDSLLAEFLTLDPANPADVSRIKELQALMRASKAAPAPAPGEEKPIPLQPPPPPRRLASNDEKSPGTGDTTELAEPHTVGAAAPPERPHASAALPEPPQPREVDVLFVEAAPLVVRKPIPGTSSVQLLPVDRLEQAEERAAIVAAADSVGRPIVLKALPGTLDGMVAALLPAPRHASRGPPDSSSRPHSMAAGRAGGLRRGFGARVLHITGHGGEVAHSRGGARRGFLLLEGPTGEGHTVFADTLAAMLPLPRTCRGGAAGSGSDSTGRPAAGTRSFPCDLAVVASCSSEAVGRALVAAGVAPLVIAVRQSARIADRVAIRFVRTLYEALTAGETAAASFTRASARARADAEKHALVHAAAASGQQQPGASVRPGADPAPAAEDYIMMWPAGASGSSSVTDAHRGAPSGSVVVATALDSHLMEQAPAGAHSPVFFLSPEAPSVPDSPDTAGGAVPGELRTRDSWFAPSSSGSGFGSPPAPLSGVPSLSGPPGVVGSPLLQAAWT